MVTSNWVAKDGTDYSFVYSVPIPYRLSFGEKIFPLQMKVGMEVGTGYEAKADRAAHVSCLMGHS